MASHWITECPHCGTSFRVTEQHLRAARGSVRCGSCLQIFNAIDTLFPTEDSEPTAKTAPPAYSPITPPPDTPEPTPFIEDAADDEDEQAEDSHFAAEALEPATDNQLNPRRQWEDEQEQFTDESDNHDPSTKESTAYIAGWKDDDHDYLAGFDTPVITAPELDTPLIDTPDLENTVLESTGHIPWNYSENADYLVSDKDDVADDAADDAALEASFNDDDITEEELEVESEEEVEAEETEEDKGELARYEAPYEEEEEEEQTDKAFNDEEPFHQETITDTAAIYTNDTNAADETEFVAPEPEPVVAEALPASTQPTPSHDDDILLVGESRVPNQYALQSEDVYQTRRDDEQGHDWQILFDAHEEPHIGPYREPFRDELLSELEAEPPRGFQWHEANKPVHTRLLWLGLNGLLLLILGVQHVFFHYNDFAKTLQTPPFNRLIDTLCETISCRFIKTDLSLIANENLIVRVHPKQDGFILLDTMMTNRASFEQPFPLLDLSFSDINEKIIARRIFKPAEYLSGDLANAAAMPINAPLHISLAIKNPGESIINYRLKLIPTSRN